MQGRLESEIKTLEITDDLMRNMPEFVNEWYFSLRASGKTASSCYDYIRKIKKFLEYIDNDIKNITPEEITLQACESYMISCQTKKDSDGMEVFILDSHQRSIRSALNNFLKYLFRQGYIEYNFMEDIKFVSNKEKVKAKHKSVSITQNDFKKILSAAKENTDCMNGLLCNRDVFVILLIMTTGIKKSAISRLDIQNVDINNKTISVISNSNKTKIFNLNEQTINYLNKWLIDRDKIKISDCENALLLGKDGKRLGDDAIGNIVKKNSLKAIGKEITSNQLSSGFCEILYKKTKDLEFVRSVAGHSSIDTTRRIVKKKGDERKKAIKIMTDILED